MQREKKPNETTKNPKTTNLKQQTQNKPTFPTQVFFSLFCCKSSPLSFQSQTWYWIKFIFLFSYYLFFP